MTRFRLSRTGASPNFATLAVVVGAIVGCGGIAFACGGGGGGGGCNGVHGDGSGGKCQTLQIVWSTPTSTAPSATPVKCTLSLTSSTLTVVVSLLAPGQACAFAAHLENIGTLAAEVNEQVSISHSAGCSYFRYSDNVPTSPPLGLAASHSYPFTGSVSLALTAGNSCQGAHATIEVTLTGSQTSCDARAVSPSDPVSSMPLWSCW